MSAFYTALIPLVPALTALVWSIVHEVRYRRNPPAKH